MNSKRKIRHGEIYYDSRSEIFSLIEQWLGGADLYRSCLNCKYWQAQPELCGKFKARPPAHIIVNSCPDYQDETDIPF